MFKTVTISVILVILLIVTVAACLIVRKYINNNILGGKGTADKSKYGIYQSNNVLKFADLIGKTAAETGIDEKFIQSSLGYLKIVFDGKLFDYDAYGSVYFSYTTDDTVSHVHTVYIHSKDIEYDECRTKLAEVYGNVRDENEEPFVEVNGGAVTRCFFDGEGFEVMLSKASEQDYVAVTINEK